MYDAPDTGLFFEYNGKIDPTVGVNAFSDADFASEPTRKPTTGIIIITDINQ